MLYHSHSFLLPPFTREPQVPPSGALLQSLNFCVSFVSLSSPSFFGDLLFSSWNILKYVSCLFLHHIRDHLILIPQIVLYSTNVYLLILSAFCKSCDTLPWMIFKKRGCSPFIQVFTQISDWFIPLWYRDSEFWGSSGMTSWKSHDFLFHSLVILHAGPLPAELLSA